MHVSLCPTNEVACSPSYTFVFSVVKSRLQAGHAHALQYKSSLHGILTIVRDEGIEGLYKGIGNKLVQSVLTAAILFAGQRRFYELTKQVSPSPSRACITNCGVHQHHLHLCPMPHGMLRYAIADRHNDLLLIV